MVMLTGAGAISNECLKRFNAKVISLRNTDPKDFTKCIKNSSVVIHNAANCNPQTFQQAFEDNTMATYRLLNLIKETNPNSLVIYLGSMSYLQNATDYKHTDNMNAYGLSKWLAEKLCLESQLKHICSLRFSTLFYNDPNRDGLSKLIDDACTKNEIHLINEGLAYRDFIPLHVAAEYIEQLTQQTHLQPTYNIVSGEKVSFKEIALHLKKRIPSLIIHNQQIDTGAEILADFKKDDVKKIGEISFSIFDEIDNILQREYQIA